MDIFSTAVLTRLVESLLRPQTFLMDKFFPNIQNHDTEEVKYDVVSKTRRLAPFVSPIVEGKIVESQGYATKTLKVAYIKDKRVFDSNKPLKRRAGETIGGNLKPSQRIQQTLVAEMADQAEMIVRRQETMAAEVLRTGKCSIIGEGFNALVDFGRDANQTIVLAGAARWGQAGISAISNLEDWALATAKLEGAMPRDIIMDIEAWRLFRKDAEVKDVINMRRVMDIEAKYVGGASGATHMGSFGQFEVWLYAEWYTDDAGVTQPLLPVNTVIGASPQTEGVRHFGAIRDEEAGYQSMEMFPKSWLNKDPSVRYLMMQSAPLLAPYRPNATFCATVN